MSKVMGTEMRGYHFGMTDDVVLMYGVLPFSWGSSPSRFVRYSDALTKLHQMSGPNDPTWNSPHAFRSSMFIDDGLFVEVKVGDRRQRSIAEWEYIARGMLSQEAISGEKEKEEGEWGEEHIFLGFCINTASMAISLPGEKKVGDTVLFDEVFSEFGSRIMRLITLQRIRGNIAHFRSTNMIWSFFTGPIDALMGYADEANTWINCGSKHIWHAFWSAMDIVRIIRRTPSSWDKLSTGRLGRLLPPEQRFACPQQPEDIVWISADATLNRIAGISWEDNEFFVFDADRLVRQFKRDEAETVIISECELIVILISVLLWYQKDSRKRTMIICADNANVFSWLNKWRSKSGTANIILKALIDFMIDAEVEIIPRYVRSEHNLAADYLTRCAEQNIAEWAKANLMQRVWIPKTWFKLVGRWKPEVDFSMLTRCDITSLLEKTGARVT